jgi:hypothetical protein
VFAQAINVEDRFINSLIEKLNNCDMKALMTREYHKSDNRQETSPRLA